MSSVYNKSGVRSESSEQQALFAWAAWMSDQVPQLAFLYHIPNGGMRSKATAAKLKAEGVKAGVPDICLPVPRGKYHGLYIELKVGKNTPSDHQKLWITGLRAVGYRAEVCYGYEAARDTILNYLGIEGGKGNGDLPKLRGLPICDRAGT